MTLGDIRGWVRDKLQDESFDTALIDPAANWFVNDLFSNNNTVLMQESDQLFFGVGDSETDLPDDMQDFIAESLNVVTPNVYPLKDFYMEYGDFMKRFPNWNVAVAGTLTYWTLFGLTMRSANPISAATTVNIDYYRTPVQMTAATDVCEVPDTYQELVVLGTLAKCMQTNEDYGEAAQELANLAPLRTTFIVNNAPGSQKTGPTIMRTNRRGGNIRERGW